MFQRRHPLARPLPLQSGHDFGPGLVACDSLLIRLRLLGSISRLRTQQSLGGGSWPLDSHFVRSPTGNTLTELGGRRVASSVKRFDSFSLFGHLKRAVLSEFSIRRRTGTIIPGPSRSREAGSRQAASHATTHTSRRTSPCNHGHPSGYTRGCRRRSSPRDGWRSPAGRGPGRRRRASRVGQRRRTSLASVDLPSGPPAYAVGPPIGSDASCVTPRMPVARQRGNVRSKGRYRD